MLLKHRALLLILSFISGGPVFLLPTLLRGGGGRGNVLTILTGIIHTMLASIKLIRKMCSGKPLVRYIAPNKLETELAQKEHDDNFSLRADKG